MISSYALRTIHRRGVSSMGSRINPSVYRSPHLGYSISWGTFWMAGPDDGEGVDPSTEVLSLQDHSGQTHVRIVCVDRSETLDPDETVRFWGSPFYLANFMEPGTIVSIADHSHCAGAVMMVGPGEDGGADTVTLKETYSTGNRTSVRVTLTAPLETFEDAYRMAQETLQIDQRSMFRFFDRDILDAVLG